MTMKDRILYWFETPDPENDEGDNIWSDSPLLRGDTVEIYNKSEWFEGPNAITIYEEHKYLFRNMGLDDLTETFYMQNLDNDDFESKMENGGELPSGQGTFTLNLHIDPQYPPSDDNEFSLVVYNVGVEVKYEVPKGVKFLPRIFARPLNWFFKRAFERRIAQDMVERDLEYAKEQMITYFDYLRKYHGEEPIQMKTRQDHYKPAPEERKFFQ